MKTVLTWFMAAAATARSKSLISCSGGIFAGRAYTNCWALDIVSEERKYTPCHADLLPYGL